MKQVIGHRGAAGYAPENTLAAFDKALSLGCHFIEFDVMLSVDGEAFVFHDETLKRTTNGQGKFSLATSEYIQSLDAGLWFSKQFRGEKIPTLREVLKWLALSNVQANIEIKSSAGGSEGTTLAVLKHIDQYWPSGKPLPLLSSFDLDAITLCHSMMPEMPLGLLLKRWQENWLQLAGNLDCFSIHLNKRIATERRIQHIKNAGFMVYVYTINHKLEANMLFNWGVDAIFSDYPDLYI